MDNKNHGILIASPRPTDWKFGGITSIDTVRDFINWSKYLSDNEAQRNNIIDFLDCTTMSMVHVLETQCNYMLQNDQFSDETINFFTDNNYFVDNKIKFSVRYNAKMNGTDATRGQYLNVAGDHVRLDGLLPDKLWNMTLSMTWNEFYSDINADLITLAKKILWFLDIKYQYINQADLEVALRTAPIQVATQVCAEWGSGNIVNKCSGQLLQHATMIYGQGEYKGMKTWLNLDHYPPYEQELAADYEFPYNMQYVVTMKPITLRNGMRGMNVRTMQHNLNRFGYHLLEDGSMGSRTAQAVINFQIKNGLKADGIAGPVTLKKIQDLLVNPKNSVIDIITKICLEEGIEPELGIAVATCESGLNPNSINKNTDKIKSIDRGLFQWNDKHHAEISDVQAFNPEQATRLFCQAVKQGNLHLFWKYSEPCWKKKVSVATLQKYGIVV